MAGGSHLSKDFFDLIKAIGESKSKQEEDRIIVYEMGELKRRLADKAASSALTGKRLKEFLIRLVYVEMLGHDASFGYMKAIELSASSNLLEKRVSYLVAGLCFSPSHEFRMMLVNRIQRDLASANVLEVTIALGAACKILTADMIPAVLTLVGNLLKHDQELVRKKAVMLLHRFLTLSPDSVTHMSDKFRRALCDKDPSVMGASLHIFADLAKADAGAYKDLVSSFVSILKQITEHRLPREFDYHRVPAPWIQLKLLRILALLGRADQAASEQMYEVLLDVMRRADTGINVGYAIIYECLRTVTTIYPNTALLDAVAGAIGRFISSDNHNLKYIGVTGLAAIVKDHPRYAAEHQLAVIDALEDPDDTLKRKTLDLLYRMTNPVNVTVIVDKLTSHLRSASDAFLRTDLVTRITGAAERFAPSNSWYINTLVTTFELAGDLVKPETAHNLIRLIAEGSGESDEADAALRREAVTALIPLLDKPTLPDVLLQTMFWVLGEYAYLGAGISLTEISDRIAVLATRAGVDAGTRGAAVAAVTKLSAQLGAIVPSAAVLITSLTASRTIDLAQRCYEFSALANRPTLLKAVLPVDASTEDIDVESDPAFNAGVNAFVSEALSAGARAYAPPSHTDDDYEGRERKGSGAGLRFDAYAKPEANVAASAPPAPEAQSAMMGAAMFATPGVPGAPAASIGGPFGGGGGGFGKGIAAGRWGKSGFETAAGVTLAQQQAAAAAAQQQPTNLSVAAPPVAADPYATETSAAAPAGGAAGGAKRPWDQPSPAAAPVPAPAPAPRELTEKEKQAALLFGGIMGGAPTPAPAPAPSATGAGRGTPVRRTGTGAPSTFAAAPAPAPTVAAPAPAPIAAAPIARAPAPAPAAGVDDLLGLFGGGAPAPAPAPSAGVSDLFGAAPRASAPAPTAADPFSGAFGGGPAASAAPPVDVNALALPAALAPVVAISGAKREPAGGNIQVAADASMVIAHHKVLAPDALHVVLFIANASATSALGGVTVQVAGVPFFSASARASTGTVTPSPGGVTVAVGAIPPRANASIILSYALTAIPTTTALRGQASYTSSMGSTPLPFTVDVPITDMLRPAPIDTATFGGAWQQPAMNAETEASVPGSSIRSLSDFASRAGASLNVHPVQMLPATSEAISAARVMGTTALVLLHTRVSPAGLAVRIKSADAGVTAAVSAAASARLR